MGVIFDLDQTLVDSWSIKAFRDKRDWPSVFSRIDEVRVYPGISEMLTHLKQRNISVAIVTSSPRSYCERIRNLFSFPIENLVCYHDTIKHKPYPDPIFLSISNMLDDSKKPILSFGDEAKDILASKAANVISVACTWGTHEHTTLLRSAPDFICNDVLDVINLIERHF